MYSCEIHSEEDGHHPESAVAHSIHFQHTVGVGGAAAVAAEGMIDHGGDKDGRVAGEEGMGGNTHVGGANLAAVAVGLLRAGSTAAVGSIVVD